jgi:hypothetical protein
MQVDQTIPTENEQIRSYAFLLTVLDAFRTKALEYYSEGDSPNDKIARTEEIHQSIKNFRSPFTIAAEEMKGEDGEEVYNCPGGMVCVGGVCIPGRSPIRD